MGLPTDSYDLEVAGGRSVRLRPLRPTDRDLYARAVTDLSPRSRYLRFLAPIERPSEKLLDKMTNIDGRLHVAYVALTPDETTAVGVVRYVRDADDPGLAEAAIAIADEWQGRGLGRELMRHTAEHARRSGLSALVATTLRENGGADRLLRACGFAPVGAGGVYLEHRLRLG
jgi:RimJ/RimL family protein N-acetyltransferase